MEPCLVGMHLDCPIWSMFVIQSLSFKTCSALLHTVKRGSLRLLLECPQGGSFIKVQIPVGNENERNYNLGQANKFLSLGTVLISGNLNCGISL